MSYYLRLKNRLAVEKEQSSKKSIWQ
jgi:hypothetical protein